MWWNHVRTGIACAAGLILFSSNAGKQGKILTPALIDHKAVPVKKDIPYSIYLTFDDGPSSSSSFIDELSRKESLPVNVFLIGQNVCLDNRNRELFRAYEANQWVEIGNHSYTHAERQYTKYFRQPSKVLADFNRSRDSLHLTNGLVRLPGRNFFRVEDHSRNDLSNGSDAADTLAANGYSIFGWDIEWCNKPKQGIGLHTGEEMLEIVNNMLTRHATFIPQHMILLLHDNELKDSCFRKELEDFIQLAKADGRYRFEHLSKYIAASPSGTLP